MTRGHRGLSRLDYQFQGGRFAGMSRPPATPNRLQETSMLLQQQRSTEVTVGRSPSLKGPPPDVLRYHSAK